MCYPLHAPLHPVVRDPQAWFACARELSFLLPELASRVTHEVDRLRNEPARYPLELMPLARAFLLLSGYAAENFLKGLWLRHRAARAVGPPADSDSFLPSGLATHSVGRFVTESGTVLTPTELETLRFLIQCVTWYARYPFPRSADSFTLFGINSDDVRRVNTLLTSLHAQSQTAGPA